ncbi:MAG: glycoside hydrolase family 3 protein [Ruminococcus sp.]|nr:glycoside hydrolase family 3 protein [Ruminococcus sp.]
MKKLIFPVLFLALLAGCGERPFIEMSPTAIPAVEIPETTVSGTETTSDNSSVTTGQTVTEAVTENTVISSGIAAEKLSKMSLHEKVCQMFIIEPESITDYSDLTYVDDWFRTCYDEYPVGGFIFFDKNIEDENQLKKLTSETQEMAQSKGTGVFISVDEEGGSVARLQDNIESITKIKDMQYYGEINDYNASYNAGRTIGSYLAEYGFNLDFAPVCDLNLSDYNELGDRIFSSDPLIVSEMAAAVSKGIESQNVSSTLKHFPGLGAGSGNTHYNTVLIERTLEQLRLEEFPAFKGAIDAGADFVMVGHQIITSVGDERPSDLSKTVVTDWLRDELGFNGIIITDSHSMGSIAYIYPASEAAVLAVEAGNDIILMPADTSLAIDGLENAVIEGRISEERIDESVMRILLKKEELGILK